MAESARNAPDMTLLPDSLAYLPERESLVMLTGKKWNTGRTLPIYFIDGPEWARAKAFGYFNRWTRQANLKMVRTSDRSASVIRVTFEPGGSWSYLGTDNLAIPKDRPTMQLGWLLRSPDNEREWQRVCLHEMGHALDFAHEQSHPQAKIPWDKEAVYAYYTGPPNNWSRSQVDRQVFFKYSVLNTNFSSYDRESIMHYSIPARFLTDPSAAVGWNTERSTLDKRTAALWYPQAALQKALDAAVGALGIAS